MHELIITQPAASVTYLQEHSLLVICGAGLPSLNLEQVGSLYPDADKAARRNARTTIRALWVLLVIIDVRLLYPLLKSASERSEAAFREHEHNLSALAYLSHNHTIFVDYRCLSGAPGRVSTDCAIDFPNCVVFPAYLKPCKLPGYDLDPGIIVNTLLDPTCAGYLASCESLRDGHAYAIRAPVIVPFLGLMVSAICLGSLSGVARRPYNVAKLLWRKIMHAQARNKLGRGEALDRLAVAADEQARRNPVVSIS